MKRFSLVTTFLITLLLSVVIQNTPIHAVQSNTNKNQSANQNAGQALEIAPPVLNLKADPGETIQAKISLRDVSTSSLLVKLKTPVMTKITLKLNGLPMGS